MNLTPLQIEALRTMDADAFAAQCAMQMFRGPGPGGQKRNKTSSSVRLTHLPSGLTARADEHRSQAMNRAAALKRLRLRAVLEFRLDIDLKTWTPPAWLAEQRAGGDSAARAGGSRAAGGLAISPRHANYLAAVGLALDILQATRWALRQAAAMLNLSTSGLSEFLQSDESLWRHVNARRAELGLKGLTAR
jgi:hypothetical protein